MDTSRLRISKATRCPSNQGRLKDGLEGEVGEVGGETDGTETDAGISGGSGAAAAALDDTAEAVLRGISRSPC